MSRNAINGGREGKKNWRGWQEEKEKGVGGGRDATEAEHVFVTCVLCYCFNIIAVPKVQFDWSSTQSDTENNPSECRTNEQQ